MQTDPMYNYMYNLELLNNIYTVVMYYLQLKKYNNYDNCNTV